jgi:hypothetical protein
MASATACQRTTQSGDLPSGGSTMPTSREESPFNKTACHVESRKSLPRTKMDGRYPHRVVRFHSRRGFISHERELLFSQFASALPAHTSGAYGASRATDLCIPLVADSASNFAGSAPSKGCGNVLRAWSLLDSAGHHKRPGYVWSDAVLPRALP